MEDRVSLAVDAPPEAVWRLFVDVERWPQMTKSTTEARLVDGGPLRVGSQAIVKQPRLPRVRWKVTELEPGRSFTWEYSSPGLTSVGGHTVEADGQGSVVTLTLRMHGPLSGPMYALVRGMSHRYITMEAEGFKRTAESESAAAG
jgi:uncharacterized membrane protein